MANSPRFYAEEIEDAVDAFCTELNSGFLEIYTGSQPAVDAALTGTLLATLTFGATAFGASSSSGGIVTAIANAITSGTAGNTGTAGYFALLKSDGTTVVATGSIGTSGCDLNISTTSINSGDNVSCSSFTVTESQS